LYCWIFSLRHNNLVITIELFAAPMFEYILLHLEVW
jgi:hypothetical protein